jgi:hypothetical protein
VDLLRVGVGLESAGDVGQLLGGGLLGEAAYLMWAWLSPARAALTFSSVIFFTMRSPPWEY